MAQISQKLETDVLMFFTTFTSFPFLPRQFPPQFCQFGSGGNRNPHKHHHHGGAICWSSGMNLAIPATPPPGASLEGVVRGRGGRILLKLISRPRKNKFGSLTILFCFLLHCPLFHCQSNGYTPPPPLPDGLASSPSSSPLLAPVLVGWCVRCCRLAAVEGHQIIYSFIFLSFQSSPQTTG